MIGNRLSLADEGNYEMQLVENDRRRGLEEDRYEFEMYRAYHFAKMNAKRSQAKLNEEDNAEKGE